MHDQVSERHGTDQDPLLVHNIADIDGLGIKTDAAQLLDGVADGHMLLKINVFDRHN